MSPVTLRRVELRLFKDAAAPHLFALPATGATVQIFHRSTTTTGAVEVEEMETVTVPVVPGAGFQFGEAVSASGGSDRDFQVRSVGANSLELDYLGTSSFTLGVGERIRSTQPRDIYLGQGGAIPPVTSLTVDSIGTVVGHIEAERFDYEVSGTAAGSAAGYYLDGRSGGGGAALTTLNVHDFASIQAAIDALPPWGGTVNIPAGNYQLTETLYLPCDRPCHLIGEFAHDHPARGTVLEWTTNVGMLRVRGDFSSVRNLKLRNTSLAQSSREDEGYGIAIGRRDRVDAHPHPEPITVTPATEYLRGENKPLYSVRIEDVVIADSPGWGIYIPGVGKISDGVTDEYDLETTGGGTLSFGLDFKRVRVHKARRYGGLFVGSGCLTTSFETCDFLYQGAGEVPNSTYYVYLASCDQPMFERCVFEGRSPADKAWIRLVGTSDAVFDTCYFENDPELPGALSPTYFIELAAGGVPCRASAVRNCRFVRGAGCGGHMNVLKAHPAGAEGLQILGGRGVSVQPAWDGIMKQFNGLAHFDLGGDPIGGDPNKGTVLTGTPVLSDAGASRQLQVGNAPRAATFASQSLGRLPGTTSSDLFNPNSDNPSRHEQGNLGRSRQRVVRGKPHVPVG